MFFDQHTVMEDSSSSPEVTGLEITFIAAAIIAGSVAACTVLFCCLNRFWKPKFNDLDPEKAHQLGPYPVSVGTKIELTR